MSIRPDLDSVTICHLHWTLWVVLRHPFQAGSYRGASGAPAEHKAYFSGTLREHAFSFRRTGKKKGKLLSSLSRARGPGCCLWGRVVVLCTTLYRAWKCAESIGPLLLNKPLLDTTNYTRCSYKQVEPMAKQLQHAAASI